MLYLVFLAVCSLYVLIREVQENSVAPFDGRERKRSWSGLFQLFTAAQLALIQNGNGKSVQVSVAAHPGE